MNNKALEAAARALWERQCPKSSELSWEVSRRRYIEDMQEAITAYEAAKAEERKLQRKLSRGNSSHDRELREAGIRAYITSQGGRDMGE